MIWECSPVRGDKDKLHQLLLGVVVDALLESTIFYLPIISPFP
jgi:hypothetical protein